MAADWMLRTIRITTKERPSDRFLTTQVRPSTSNENVTGDALYFLVEIHNPWFPNSQIGQTIINTIVREYHRGESTSVLVNFELALRKTNTVLAQITQNGETDWIGNLSSLILLVSDNHVHVAQTGHAQAYLYRGEKVSAITEGLEEEAGLHPLTTYTNITTGSLEANDILLLASSEIASTIGLNELKEILGGPDLRQSAREMVRRLQRLHYTKANALLLSPTPTTDQLNETIYLDQSLNTLPEFAHRLFSQIVRPTLQKTHTGLRTGSRHSLAWSRDWLVPRLIDWGKKSGQALKSTSQAVVSGSKPVMNKVLKKPTLALTNRLKKIMSRSARTKNPVAQAALAGQTIYRVHHYDETPNKQPRKFRQFWGDQNRTNSNPLLKKIFAVVRAVSERLRQWRFRPNRTQVLFLSISLIVILIITISATSRRATQVAEVQETTASTALADAKTAQEQAERTFLLNDKEAAKNQFFETITLAKLAATNGSTATEAEAIINQSQAIIDQLTTTTRFSPGNALVSFPKPIGSLTKIGTDILAAASASPALYQSSASAEIGQPVTLPGLIVSGAATNFGNDWLLAGTEQTVYRFQTGSQSVSTESGSWPTITNLATFGTNLYALEATAGQIWKYPQKTTGFGERTGYLKSPDPTGLSQAVALAIDGDVFMALADGSVKKYTRGLEDKTWQLHNLPSPWDKIQKPKSIFTTSESSHFYLFEEQVSSDQPARLLEFAKNGAYLRQLFLPVDWPIEALWFDSLSQTGLVVNDQKAYPITFPNS